MQIKEIWNKITEFVSEQENSDEPLYDPIHFAAMIVIVIFSIGVLFWLFWSLLVFKGGISQKIVPAIQVLFTKKTLQDFGWVGYPFELGVFEGFIANSVALVLTIGLIYGIWWIFDRTKIEIDEVITGAEKDENTDQ